MSLFRRRQLRRLSSMKFSLRSVSTGGWVWTTLSSYSWTTTQTMYDGREVQLIIECIILEDNALFDLSYRPVGNGRELLICTYSTWNDAVDGAQAFVSREIP